MSSKNGRQVERLADSFISYLFDKYKGSRHVRRVASWIGFLLKAMEEVGGSTLKKNRQRQIVFEYKRRKFKARYNHKAGRRGGIEIVEVLAGRGAPEGEIAVTVTSLDEAERCYLKLRKQLDLFVRSH